MTPRYAQELSFMLELIEESGQIAKRLFCGKEFRVFTKADGSKATNIDLAVSDHVVARATKKGIGVRSEERGSTAGYDGNKVFDLDSIDSTSDLIAGRSRRPRRSLASPSLGYWDDEPVAGAVIFPLLGTAPVTYFASKGGDAYRLQDGRKVRLQIDTAPTHGIVFVTSKKDTPAAVKLSKALGQIGYTPVSAHGAVFKACSVADPELFSKIYPYHGEDIPPLPVVGSMSQGGVYLHDVAAATCPTSPRAPRGCESFSDSQPLSFCHQAYVDESIGIVYSVTVPVSGYLFHTFP